MTPETPQSDGFHTLPYHHLGAQRAVYIDETWKSLQRALTQAGAATMSEFRARAAAGTLPPDDVGKVVLNGRLLSYAIEGVGVRDWDRVEPTRRYHVDGDIALLTVLDTGDIAVGLRHVFGQQATFTMNLLDRRTGAIIAKTPAMDAGVETYTHIPGVTPEGELLLVRAQNGRPVDVDRWNPYRGTIEPIGIAPTTCVYDWGKLYIYRQEKGVISRYDPASRDIREFQISDNILDFHGILSDTQVLLTRHGPEEDTIIVENLENGEQVKLSTRLYTRRVYASSFGMVLFHNISGSLYRWDALNTGSSVELFSAPFANLDIRLPSSSLDAFLATYFQDGRSVVLALDGVSDSIKWWKHFTYALPPQADISVIDEIVVGNEGVISCFGTDNP